MAEPGKSKAIFFVIAAVVVILFLVGLVGGAIGQALDISSPDFLHVPILQIHEFFKGDVLFDVGPLSVSNTMLASWVTVIAVSIFALIATRKMRIVPKRLQAVVEVGIETLMNFVVSVAGEKNGRRFFPIIATIFIFVMFNAYFALMPFFGPGITVAEHGEAVAEHAGIVQEVKVGELGEHIKAEADGTVATVEVHDGESVEKDDVIYTLKNGDTIEAEEKGVVLDLLHEGDSIHEKEVVYTVLGHVAKDDVFYVLENGDEIVAEIGGHVHHLTLKAVGDEVTAHESVAELISKPPLFRSANTDVNMTLALAIMAVFCIEFWGLRSRGFRHYISEYLNFGELFTGVKLLFSSKIKDAPMAILMGVINAFMGFIEMLSHAIRMVSFTFRLFGNMTAGEILLVSATFLVPWIMAIPFYGLELLVGFIQALIFGGLTLVWATMAVEHASEEH
ncbi:F0F1 ATP synthase subunit A [Chloroflexota bacterium]